ncbi:hypothetical protein, partial [Thiolapillus sp.]|uniref:hypothetical protein n=1 Tax=Thiolapillus sp. TaxID=2017437 RepID=UPI003AF48B0D
MSSYHFSTPLRLYQPYACATDTGGEGQKNGKSSLIKAEKNQVQYNMVHARETVSQVHKNRRDLHNLRNMLPFLWEFRGRAL